MEEAWPDSNLQALCIYTVSKLSQAWKPEYLSTCKILKLTLELVLHSNTRLSLVLMGIHV